jgi:hypothetical protein
MYHQINNKSKVIEESFIKQISRHLNSQDVFSGATSHELLKAGMEIDVWCLFHV